MRKHRQVARARRRGRSAETALLAAALTLLAPARGVAIDHGNLDEGRPLRIEDPYTIARGEWSVEGGVAYARHRDPLDRGSVEAEIRYGAALNFEAGVGARLVTDPGRGGGGEGSGDVHASALYNLNRESITLPALGLKALIRVPTRSGSHRADAALLALVTRSAGRISFHANGGLDLGDDPASDGLRARWRAAFGASAPIGAPRHTRTLLLADLFAEQAENVGGDATLGIEMGTRRQWTQRVVLDAALGFEVAGSADRRTLYLRAGVSRSF